MRASRFVRFAALSAALALCACTSPRGPRDPFAGGTSPAREGVQHYRVRLEVVCDQCLITATVGPSTRSVSPGKRDQVWSTSFSRYPRRPEAIRLTARPRLDGGPLRSLRIYVNGEVVASAACDADGAVGKIEASGCRTLTAETVIPLRLPV